jgi:hypothetical protein
MTNATSPASAPQLRAVSVSLDVYARVAWIDGARFPVRFEASHGDLYGGKASVNIYEDGPAVVVHPEEWADAHPDVEPSAAALAMVFDDAGHDLVEQAMEVRE